MNDNVIYIATQSFAISAKLVNRITISTNITTKQFLTIDNYLHTYVCIYVHTYCIYICNYMALENLNFT